jgi:hypothetical protein
MDKWTLPARNDLKAESSVSLHLGKKAKKGEECQEGNQVKIENLPLLILRDIPLMQ